VTRAALRLLLALALLVPPGPARGYDSHCGAFADVCDDANGFAAARKRWGVAPNGSLDGRAEHLQLWLEARRVSGLPDRLDEPFTLTQFSLDDPLAGGLESIRPVRLGARARRERTLVLGELAQLPDFSYTLWDWAAGNEICPPDDAQNPDECHLYAPHIGLLNSNHMVPQAERFYAWYHQLALERADACRTAADALPAGEVERFDPYLLACEKQALAIEAVGHHFLQDAWSMGHMWERWGGPEVADFAGRRTLGFAVALAVGLIHGSKAILDDLAVGGVPLGPFDDPMCAPRLGQGLEHLVGYVDGAATPGSPDAFRPGAGDIFLARFVLNPEEPAFAPQRRAALGCAVDGMRAVYGRTAQRHGAMAPPDGGAVDLRDVRGAGCWGQRATNQALAEGFGIHHGVAPTGNTEFAGMTAAQSLIATAFLFYRPGGLPELSAAEDFAFRRDMASATMLAKLKALNPLTALHTDLASGGLPPIGRIGSFPGILPNSAYARGGADAPPVGYADPPLPWTLDDPDPAVAVRKEALNLALADAHAADRCRELTELDLSDQRGAVASAREAGDAALLAVRCAQCVQMLTPHLRFGRPGGHDPRREAFCAYVAPGLAAFAFTDEDPARFTGNEPPDLESIRAGARLACGCDETTTTTTTSTSSTTTTTIVGGLTVDVCMAEPGPGGGCVAERTLGDLEEAIIVVRVRQNGMPAAGVVELSADVPPSPVPETCPVCGDFFPPLTAGNLPVTGQAVLLWATPPGAGTVRFTARLVTPNGTLEDSAVANWNNVVRPPNMDNRNICHEIVGVGGCVSPPAPRASMNVSAGVGDRGSGPIVMDIAGAPDGASCRNFNGGSFGSCTVAAGQTPPGGYAITFTATDVRGLSASVVFQVAVGAETVSVSGP